MTLALWLQLNNSVSIDDQHLVKEVILYVDFDLVLLPVWRHCRGIRKVELDE
jgi:hypothetical protein